MSSSTKSRRCWPSGSVSFNVMAAARVGIHGACPFEMARWTANLLLLKTSSRSRRPRKPPESEAGVLAAKPQELVTPHPPIVRAVHWPCNPSGRRDRGGVISGRRDYVVVDRQHRVHRLDRACGAHAMPRNALGRGDGELAYVFAEDASIAALSAASLATVDVP